MLKLVKCPAGDDVPVLGRLSPAGLGGRQCQSSGGDGVAVSAGDSSVSVEVGLHNLGAGGWRSKAAAVEAMLFVDNIPLVAMTETHLRFGSSYWTDSRMCVYSYTRQVVDLNSKCGGVALAARRDDNSVVREVAVLRDYCSRLADVAWFRIRLGDAAVPLFVAVFYWPPVGSPSLCGHEWECTDVGCHLVHPQRAMEELSVTMKVLAKHGPVLVLGDANATAPEALLDPLVYSTRDTRNRGWALYESVVDDEGVVLVNALAGDVQATRRDRHTGRESQLDWVLFARHFQAGVSALRIDELASSTDHYLLKACVHIARRVRQQRQSAAEHRQEVQRAVTQSHGALQSVCDVPVVYRSWRPRVRDKAGTLGPVELAQRRRAVVDELLAWWRTVRGEGSEERGDSGVRRIEWPSYEQQIDVCYRVMVRCGVVAPLRGRNAQRLLQAPLDVELPAPQPAWVQVVSRVRAVKRELKMLSRKQRRVTSGAKQVQLQAEVGVVVAELRALNKQWRGLSRSLRAAARARKWRQLRKAIVDQRHQAAADIISAMVSECADDVVGAIEVDVDGGNRPGVSARVERLTLWLDELRERYQPADVVSSSSGGSRQDGTGRERVAVEAGVSAGRFPELCEPVQLEEVQAALRRLKGKAAGTGVPMCELKAWLGSRELLCTVTEYVNDVFLGEVPIPEAWTRVTMTPVPKPGLDPKLPSSCRCIAYGDTLGRVLQAVITRRLLVCVKQHGLLHPSQGGFVLDSSNELVVWSSHVVLEQCRRRGVPVWQLFVDIRRAFGSCRHDHIVQAMRDAGIGGVMLQFIGRWLQQTTIMTASGALALVPIAVLSGLCEGVCFSPILWALFLDPLARRIVAVCDKDSVPEVAGQLWPMDNFADDMSLFLTCRRRLGVVVDVLEAFATERHLEINLGSGKTEVMYHCPLDKSGVRLRNWVMDRNNSDVARGGVGLMMGDKAVLQTWRYKHLGRQVHADGGKQSVVEHLKHVRKRMGMWKHRMAKGGIRDMPADLGRLVLITRVRMSWKYAVAMWADRPAINEIAASDMQLQKHVILRSRYLSDAVVFAVMGVRSVEAEWHLSVVTLALQLAALPDDHIRRRALAALWVEWREVVDREEASRLRIVLRDIWWARLHAVLSLMDYTEAADVVEGSPYVATGVQWVRDMAFVVDVANDGDERRRRLSNMRRHAAFVLEWWDWQRNRARIRDNPALVATSSLMEGPVAEAPFLTYPRSVDNMLRVRLRGGTRQVLRLFKHMVVECPWCGERDMTVPHLLRDCPAWANHREVSRQQVKAVAVRSGLMAAHTRTDKEFVEASPFWSEQWYRLLVGAPVSKRLLSAGPLFQLATQGRAKSKSNRIAVPGKIRNAYGEMLGTAGQLLIQVIHRTQAHFGVRRFDVDELYFSAKHPRGRTKQQKRARRQRRR